MNQRDIVQFGTEADKVDNSIIGISILKLQLVAKACRVFNKIQQFGNRFDSTSEDISEP
jgi:hypothetical protein